MNVRRFFYIEAGLAAAFAVTCVITLMAPDWIERVFDAAPDQGSGEAEWGIAAVLGSVAIVCSVLAHMEWRRARRVSSEASNV
jgi:hypothetical protein